jgi:hypothetical protein
MATCKFGEDVTKYVIHLYENRLEDKKVNRKDVLVFCLIHCCYNINSKTFDTIVINNWFLTLSVRAEYMYSVASHVSCPDGVLILRDFHKVLK